MRGRATGGPRDGRALALDGPRTPTGRAVPGTDVEHAMAMAHRAWRDELRGTGRYPNQHMDGYWDGLPSDDRAAWLARAAERIAREAELPIGEPRILAAAVIHAGRVYAFPSPGRHHDAIRKVRLAHPKAGRGLCPPDAQGFVLEDGAYVGREEGGRIALASGQALTLHTEGLLFSEDLW